MKSSSTALQKRLIVVISLILVISAIVSSSYRGIAHDEGLGFGEVAVNVIRHQPVYDPQHNIGNCKEPTRLIYTLLIALGYKLCGVTLVALHLFPYLIQIVNPAIFFVALYRMYGRLWWSVGGAVALVFLPFNLTYLNQQHTHPIFLGMLLLMMLVLTTTLRPPLFWGSMGCLSGLLILTRYEDAVMYVGALFLAYLLTHWKERISFGWIAVSIGIIVVMYVVAALLFQFPLTTYWEYVPAVLARQERRAGTHSWLQLTQSAFRIIVNWYLLGKLLAPVLTAFVGIGAFISIKQRAWYPLALFFPHFLFLVFVYNGRETVNSLPVITFTTPGFIMLTMAGVMSVAAGLARYVTLAEMRWKVLLGLIVFGTLGLWGRSIYSIAMVVEDSQPASTIWHIWRANPRLPGHPDYQQPTVRLSRERDTSAVLPEHLLLRENVYKAVRGVYRPWALHRIGQYAFDLGLPQQAQQQADLVFLADYDAENAWPQGLMKTTGTSALWSQKYPGRIGAFPHGAHGTVIYKFEAAQPIAEVVISGIHTQWGIGDVVKMWTSPDGTTWTLRYGGWNARYAKDLYYQFFETEFDGASALYVKYYFRAGDQTRSSEDNRGASLEQFGVAITYKKRYE